MSPALLSAFAPFTFFPFSVVVGTYFRNSWSFNAIKINSSTHYCPRLPPQTLSLLMSSVFFAVREWQKKNEQNEKKKKNVFKKALKLNIASEDLFIWEFVLDERKVKKKNKRANRRVIKGNWEKVTTNKCIMQSYNLRNPAASWFESFKNYTIIKFTKLSTGFRNRFQRPEAT